MIKFWVKSATFLHKVPWSIIKHGQRIFHLNHFKRRAFVPTVWTLLATKTTTPGLCFSCLCHSSLWSGFTRLTRIEKGTIQASHCVYLLFNPFVLHRIKHRTGPTSVFFFVKWSQIAMFCLIFILLPYFWQVTGLYFVDYRFYVLLFWCWNDWWNSSRENRRSHYPAISQTVKGHDVFEDSCFLSVAKTYCNRAPIQTRPAPLHQKSAERKKHWAEWIDKQKRKYYFRFKGPECS